MSRNLRVKNVRIVGVIPSYAFQRAKYFVLELHRSMPLRFPEPEIEGILEMEWYQRLTEWRHFLGPEIWRLRRPVAVFLDGKFIGSDIELLKLTSLGNIYVESIPMQNSSLMKRKFKEDYLIHLKNTKHIYCYFDICVDDNFVGTLVFQLYSNILPKTCENFTTLCLGTKGSFLSYKGSRIHRIVKKGWLQGGDIQFKTAEGGFSIYCSPLQDECYGISHDRRGILSMANNGKHINGSQFFITLNPCTWMDTYYVAFGQLIQGVNVLNFIENVNTFRECPLKKIEIKNCGKLNLEDMDDLDAKYREDFKDAAPKKKPKKIEKIANQVARLVMEAVTECLAVKERSPDVTHIDDVPSGINLDFYFQGYYSLPNEVLEDSAKYLRNLRRELLRNLRPSATEVAEVITYDLLGAVFIKYINLDDVREAAEHSIYKKLIEGIDMKLEMVDKPYVKKFVDQLAATAETTVRIISTKLNWMRRNKFKTRVFQEKMNDWIQSFVLQETFADDNFRIAERSSHVAPKKKHPRDDEISLGETKPKSKPKENVCEYKKTKTEKKPMDICCRGKEIDTDLEPTISQYFNHCLYYLKRVGRHNEGSAQILDLIEHGRYQLRILRGQEERRRSNARICLEKRIHQWMKEVVYISETEWIRQTLFAKDDACLNHHEEIMYGAMTIGLLEMYYLMEEYLKRPKVKKYRTRLLYPEDDDSLKRHQLEEGQGQRARETVAGESSCSESQENILEGRAVEKRREGETARADKIHKPCMCGDVCCDCTSEPRNDEDLDLMVAEVLVAVPPTPPPSPEAVSVVSEEQNVIPEYIEESSCSQTNEAYVDVEEILAQVTGESVDKINIKSFKWLQEYILENSCQLKSDFAGQVHSWLDTEVFNYRGFLSKHSLVTRASLLSFSISLASLLKEENNLKSEIKDFIYNLWELYFKEMFKEALMENPPKSEGSQEVIAEPEEPGTRSVEEEMVEEKEDVKEAYDKVKLLVKDDFDFDKFCQESGKENEEPQAESVEEPQEKREEVSPAAPFKPRLEDIPKIEVLTSEDYIYEAKTQETVEEKEILTKRKSPIVIRELIKSSEEIRPSSRYTTPFWVRFLGEITKRSLGLIAKLSRLPRRLYFTSESQTSFDDKIKSWIEFNNFSSPTTGGKDIRDFIAEHHVSVENLDETARSFLRKKVVWDVIEKSSRALSSELLAEELVLDLIMKVIETVEHGEDERGKLSQEILQGLIGSATVNSTEISDNDVNSREETSMTDVESTEKHEDLEND